MPVAKETKAHEMAVEYIKMKQTTTNEDKPQFKLKRFQEVGARIVTNRKWSPDQLLPAWHNIYTLI